VKKLFSIGSPVILVTLGVALLFIIRKKRKEKRLKRLRGEKQREGGGKRGKRERGEQRGRAISK
jgi:cytochrome c-type biogenesis protein CcmH/NrfF